MSLRRFLGKDEALPFLSGPAVCTCSRVLPVSGHTAFLVPVWYHWVERACRWLGVGCVDEVAQTLGF